MKKLLLALLILPLLAIGCGAKKADTSDTPPQIMPFDGASLPATYVQTHKLATLATPDYPTVVNDVTYEILNNTGGAATIVLGRTALNTTCPAIPSASPLATLNVPAGINSTAYTSFGPAMATAFTSILVNDDVLCAYITQGNPTMKFDLQVVANYTTTYGK